MEGWQIALIIILAIIVIGLIIFGFWWFFKKRKEKNEREKLKGGADDFVKFGFLKNHKEFITKLLNDNVLIYSSTTVENGITKAVSKYITYALLSASSNPDLNKLQKGVKEIKEKAIALDNVIRICLNYIFGSVEYKSSESKKEFICGLSLEHFRAAFPNNA